jgi:hypothetical protein
MLKNAALPLIMYAVLGALLFLNLPSRFRSTQLAPSDAGNAGVVTVPDQPLSGGIYAPSVNRLMAQTGTHFRVDGWLGIRDSQLVVRRVVLMMDDKPLADAQLLMVRADPSGKALRCEWGNQLLLTGIEPGDHRLQAVAFLQDGRRIPLDEKIVMVWD